MFEAASERLLNASATIETDPEASPITPLPAQSRMLQMMPTIPANCP